MPFPSTFTTGSVPDLRTDNLKDQVPCVPFHVLSSSLVKFISACFTRNLEALDACWCLLANEIFVGSHALLFLSPHLVPSIWSMTFPALLTFSISSIFTISVLLPMVRPWVCHAIHSTVVVGSVPPARRILQTPVLDGEARYEIDVILFWRPGISCMFYLL